MRRRQFILIVVVVLAVTAAMLSGMGIRQVSGQEHSANPADQWEYLAVGGASNVNFNPTDNPSMRKEPGGFAREDSVLEGHMDRLGKKGWELVTVTPDPRAGAMFIFKRRKF